MFTKTDMENLPFVDHFRTATPWISLATGILWLVGSIPCEIVTSCRGHQALTCRQLGAQTIGELA